MHPLLVSGTSRSVIFSDNYWHQHNSFYCILRLFIQCKVIVICFKLSVVLQGVVGAVIWLSCICTKLSRNVSDQILQHTFDQHYQNKAHSNVSIFSSFFFCFRKTKKLQKILISKIIFKDLQPFYPTVVKGTTCCERSGIEHSFVFAGAPKWRPVHSERYHRHQGCPFPTAYWPTDTRENLDQEQRGPKWAAGLETLFCDIFFITVQLLNVGNTDMILI